MTENNIKIGDSNETYSKLIWIWRNDKKTREMSKNQELISWEDHKSWFKNALKNNNKIILMGFYDEKPVGVIFLNLIQGSNNDYLIGINVSPQHRGKGIGNAILKKTIKKIKNDYPLIKRLYAHVRKDNNASYFLFKNIGFSLKNSNNKDYFIFFLRIDNESYKN